MVEDVFEVPSMAMHRTTLSPKCCWSHQFPAARKYRRTAYRDFQHQSLPAIVGLESIQNRWKLLGREFDCFVSSQARVLVFKAREILRLRAGLELTIHDSTNDLMNLAISSVGRSEASRHGGREALLQWLEASWDGMLSPNGSAPKGSSNAAVVEDLKSASRSPKNAAA